jgi:hypothetical protein
VNRLHVFFFLICSGNKEFPGIYVTEIISADMTDKYQL